MSSINMIPTVRLGDRDDCRGYSSCLFELAKLEGKSGYRADHLKLPCESCKRYRPIPTPEALSFQRTRSVFETAV